MRKPLDARDFRFIGESRHEWRYAIYQDLVPQNAAARNRLTDALVVRAARRDKPSVSVLCGGQANLVEAPQYFLCG